MPNPYLAGCAGHFVIDAHSLHKVSGLFTFDNLIFTPEISLVSRWIAIIIADKSLGPPPNHI